MHLWHLGTFHWKVPAARASKPRKEMNLMMVMLELPEKMKPRPVVEALLATEVTDTAAALPCQIATRGPEGSISWGSQAAKVRFQTTLDLEELTKKVRAIGPDIEILLG